jgi:disulfide bond formation protein DsbB
MTVERYLRLIAGIVVFVSVVLGIYHSPYWFGLTIFVSLNLMQSAFTNWCPMMAILRWLGAKDDTGSLSTHV